MKSKRPGTARNVPESLKTLPPGTLKPLVEFRPQDKVTRVPAGTTIFNAANWVGLPIDSTCGGLGTCGKCKIRFVKGGEEVTAADRKTFSEQELGEGWRLSCRAIVYGDVICEVPRLMGNPKAALMGFGRHVLLDPNVHKVALHLEPPSLEDQRSDLDRIRDALDKEGFEIHADLSVLKELPRLLRTSSWEVTAVVVGSELVAVEGGDTTKRVFGIAFDIGTTTVVVMLIDLTNGSPVAVKSALNGQAIFGADVISRISYAAMHEDGLAHLTEKIRQTLNGLIDELLIEANVKAGEVYEGVGVGNTTMLHLFLGLEPAAIGVQPFIPVTQDPTLVSAGDVGLGIHPRAPIHLLPHLGAYVGADLVGGLLATGLAQNEGVRLLVDVGTNGEIILGSQSGTVATSAPAGPAFEGAQIRDGMRASSGAIEGVEITRTVVRLQVIGDVPPIGLCGSGLLDVVAQLRLAGLLDASGKLVSEEAASRLVDPAVAKRLVTLERNTRAFVLAYAEESGHERPVVLTQRDIRELQFAKAAIASGIDVLMRAVGVTADDLAEIYLAGSFGSYINPQSARIVGLVPPVPVERIKAVGNSAGEGAKIALLSFREREVARTLRQVVEYHELSGRVDFDASFVSVLQFPDLTELGLQPMS